MSKRSAILKKIGGEVNPMFNGVVMVPSVYSKKVLYIKINYYYCFY